MSEITSIQLEFNKRFLYVVQELKALNKIKSIKELAQNVGVTYQRYTEMDRGFRQNSGESRYKTVEIEMIYELVKNYNINADWLITGRGSMFK